MLKNKSPITQHTPNVSLKDAPGATSPRRSGWQKKTSDHLEKKIFLMYNNHLSRNQQFVSKLEDSEIKINQMNNDLNQERQARVSLLGKLEEIEGS